MVEVLVDDKLFTNKMQSYRDGPWVCVCVGWGGGGVLYFI